MAKQTINIGTSANDGTGDTPRTAFGKANDNFNELYTEVANLKARNLVTLHSELIGPGAPLAVAACYALTVPRSFILLDAALSFVQAGNDGTVNAALQTQGFGGGWVNQFANSGAITNRSFLLGVNAGGITLPAGTAFRVNLAAFADGYTVTTLGLQLWLRGVWA